MSSGSPGPGADQVDLAHRRRLRHVDGLQDARAPLASSFAPKSRPMRFRVRDGAFRFRADQLRAVGRDHHAQQMQPCRPSTVAYAPIGTWQPPPSAASTPRSAVTAACVAAWSSARQASQPGPSRASRWPARPVPPPEHITSGGRISAMRSRPAQPLQTGGGQHDRVVLAFVQLAQARVQVAAHRFDRQIRTQPAQLRGAPQRTGADLRARAADRPASCRPWRRADLRAPGSPPAPGPPAVRSAGPSGCARRDRRGRRAAPLRSPS